MRNLERNEFDHVIAGSSSNTNNIGGEREATRIGYLACRGNDDQLRGGWGPKKDLPRYQIVSTSEGLHSIFRVDTVTGEVSYCFVVSDSNDFNAPSTGVRCVPPAR